GRLLSRTDWGWVLKGMKIALPLFAASLSVNFIITVDRYWFSFLQGEANLGAYVFYMSIASAMITFMDAGIFSFLYPKLLACHSNKDNIGFLSGLKSMFFQVALVSILFVAIVFFFAGWFFSLLGVPVFSENIGILLLLYFIVFLKYLRYFHLYFL